MVACQRVWCRRRCKPVFTCHSFRGVLSHLGVFVHLGARVLQRVSTACWQLAVLCVRAVLQVLEAMHVPCRWLLSLSVPVTDSMAVLCPRTVFWLLCKDNSQCNSLCTARMYDKLCACSWRLQLGLLTYGKTSGAAQGTENPCFK